jgi:outer membrane protein assembly factor BamE (lipoprotein component of BamABCDE complex)
MRTSTFSRTFLGSVAAAALVLSLSACESRLAARGHLPDPEKLAEIKPGEMTKDEVAEILGSPSSVAPFEGDTWYYISEQQKRVAFFAPEVTDRKIVILRFDDQGVVKEIDDKGLEAARQVDPVGRTTPTLGQDLTAIEQLLGNFNRYRSKDRKAPEGGPGPSIPGPTGGY